MSGQSPHIRQIMANHLRPGEEIIWFEGGGQIPKNQISGYWFFIPTIAWIILSIRMSFGEWQPEQTSIFIKLSLAALFTGWGLFVLWVIWGNVREQNNIIYTVTNQRLLVSNEIYPKNLVQAEFAELGRIEASGLSGSGILYFVSNSLLSLTPFFSRYSTWMNISEPDLVKSLIEQRISRTDQEATQ